MVKLMVLNGAGGTETVETYSRGAAFRYDGEQFEPAVTQRVEYDNEGQMSQTTTVCGETENRRSGENAPKLTIEGVVTEDQLDPLKAMQYADEVRLVSDVHEGEITVRRLTIGQNTDVIQYRETGGDEWQPAFAFQIQNKQPNSNQ